MTQISAYINFDGNCREAMTFYQECLGGELDLQRLGDAPKEFRCPLGMEDQIMHGALLKDTMLLMGSDMTGPEGQGKGSAIALSINCESEEEINASFAALSKGGKVQLPLQQMFWGGMFGTLTDKFGIRWMFNYDNRGGIRK